MTVVSTPSAFGTSPKYDESNFESSYKIFIVVFGGGRVGAAFDFNFQTFKRSNMATASSYATL